MKQTLKVLAVAFLVSTLASDRTIHAATIDKDAYNRCTSTASSGKANVNDAIAACRTSAEQQVPGAMYVLGALLLKRADGHAQGMKWLERAASLEHPAAGLTLARIYLSAKDETVIERGRAMLRMAACSGYPEAVKLLEEQRLSSMMLNCRKSPFSDFSGSWIGKLESLKPAGDGPRLKFVVTDNIPHVFRHSNDSWTEVKPGKFSLIQKDASAVISSLDSGWDFDGQWIESWDIHMLRLSQDEAFVTFTRTVNNPDMPAAMEWRTFTSIAEGVFKREK